jgi:hypothetical protein
MRTWKWGALATMIGVISLLLTACGQEQPSGQKETDPAYKLEVEQVRFVKKGIFPFDFLVGRAFLRSDKVIPSNYTWYPDPKSTAVRVFEDGLERPVLEIRPFAKYGKKVNILVVAMVTKGLAVGQGGGNDIQPQLRETLKSLAKGYDDNLYNLSVVLCWGKVERRYPFTSKDASAQFLTDMDALVYPGASEGSFMACLEPTLADLDWLQRATPEQAADATLKHGTMPLFFKDSQSWRTNVVLMTDGEPFREGSLDTFSDLIVKGNFPLYTLGVATSTEGEKGLARLRDLYERRKMGGDFILLPDHQPLPGKTQELINSWLDEAHAFVVEYLSGYSGIRGTEMPLWAAWKNGQYTSRQVRATPGSFNQPLRWTLRGLTVLLMIAGFVYFLYHFRIWPFREKVRVIPCPEGCGHLIPEDWPVCRFCELKGVWGRLVLLNGDRAGKVFFLRNDYYSIGSGRDDDIIVTSLPDLPVVPAHASLHWVQQGQKIVLRSESGSMQVARRKSAAPAVNLRFGDIVELGEGGVSAVLLRGVGRTY